MNTYNRVLGAPASIRALIGSDLLPQVTDIDRKGVYPRDFMHALGALGGFESALTPREQIGITTAVAEACGATSFLVWCQSSCGMYLRLSENPAVRERYLRAVSRGELLAGTGMSNAVKHLDGIEKIHLRARRESSGYRVSGALPWVSNADRNNLLIVAAAVQGEDGYIMFAVPGDAAGFELHRCLEFSGLEGTSTLNLRFHDVHVPHADVLAQPAQFDDYLRRIRPAFVLGQTGMGIGIARACLQIIHDSNAGKEHVNRYLDDQHDDLAQDLDALEGAIADQCDRLEREIPPLLPILKLRAGISELTLRSANSALLHAGAKGYLTIHPAQRRLREAMFVAIVTPALKHLRKQIHMLEHATASLESAT